MMVKIRDCPPKQCCGGISPRCRLCVVREEKSTALAPSAAAGNFLIFCARTELNVKQRSRMTNEEDDWSIK
ncbi:hypothetical protein ACFX13_018247 [Malus domestica]